MRARVDGKVALVTGAARGIGAAAAERLAAEGASVVLTDILDEEGQDRTQKIKENGGEATYMSLDVADKEAWQRVIDDTLERYGALHILVNNAGIGALEDVESETIEGWERVIDINQKGVWLGMKLAGPHLRETGNGSIINISSIYGKTGGDGTAIAYHAAKGAVTLMTKNAAVFYAEKGVRVNSVHPGFVDTPLVAAENVGEEAAEALESWVHKMTPMDRMGDSEEIAHAVVFLASDEASYMTGSELYVDGGWTAW
jgi:NAD(P)-dependent dehydrogenase (short-subunit alcohol dehydrogenase family)